MNDLNSSHSDSTKKGFEKALSRHGFGFHYRVLRECFRLYKEKRSPWRYVESEFPLEVQGKFNRKRIRGTINGGGVSIDLHTVNGGISIYEE